MELEYNVSDVTSIVQMVQLENNVTGQWVGMGILFSLFVILFFTLEYYTDTWKSLTIASFISIIVSIFFVAFAIAPPSVFVIFSALLIAGIFLSRKRSVMEQ